MIWFLYAYLLIAASVCFWVARNTYADIASDELDEDVRTFVPFLSILYGLFWPLIAVGMLIYWLAYRKKVQ